MLRTIVEFVVLNDGIKEKDESELAETDEETDYKSEMLQRRKSRRNSCLTYLS